MESLKEIMGANRISDLYDTMNTSGFPSLLLWDTTYDNLPFVCMNLDSMLCHTPFAKYSCVYLFISLYVSVIPALLELVLNLFAWCNGFGKVVG